MQSQYFGTCICHPDFGILLWLIPSRFGDSTLDFYKDCINRVYSLWILKIIIWKNLTDCLIQLRKHVFSVYKWIILNCYSIHAFTYWCCLNTMQQWRGLVSIILHTSKMMQLRFPSQRTLIVTSVALYVMIFRNLQTKCRHFDVWNTLEVTNKHVLCSYDQGMYTSSQFVKILPLFVSSTNTFSNSV